MRKFARFSKILFVIALYHVITSLLINTERKLLLKINRNYLLTAGIFFSIFFGIIFDSLPYIKNSIPYIISSLLFFSFLKLNFNFKNLLRKELLIIPLFTCIFFPGAVFVLTQNMDEYFRIGHILKRHK